MESSTPIRLAREKADALYAGQTTPHRSCGIAIAETFNCAAGPYQALRRGGLTGDGPCGAFLAGQMVLGEFLGDPAPPGDMTPALKDAILFYKAEWDRRVERGGCAGLGCNDLIGRFSDFQGTERKSFCTSLAAQTAELVAETLLRFGATFEVTPIPD